MDDAKGSQVRVQPGYTLALDATSSNSEKMQLVSEKKVGPSSRILS